MSQNGHVLNFMRMSRIGPAAFRTHCFVIRTELYDTCSKNVLKSGDPPVHQNYHPTSRQQKYTERQRIADMFFSKTQQQKCD